MLPAPPGQLFESYLDPVAHAEITGAMVSIGRSPGDHFNAFDGAIVGRILHVVPMRLIVQTWRATHWGTEDLDSILVLTFSEDPAGGRIDLVHVNVPEHDYEDVREGWEKYYWAPWRRYLVGRLGGFKNV
jgi:activator of HSP90 ATPase